MADEMYRSIMHGSPADLDRLAAAGVSPADVTPSEKWNDLHRALLIIRRSPSPAMIERLIGLGVDVDAVDSFRNTPLHYAVNQKTPEADSIVKLLVVVGAKVNVFNERRISVVTHRFLLRSCC